MTDPTPLLARIAENSGDDGPRLVYADWLEENGESDRAELIRVQIKMAMCRMCHRKDGTPRSDGYTRNCGRCVPGRRRESELLRLHAERWSGPAWPWCSEECRECRGRGRRTVGPGGASMRPQSECPDCSGHGRTAIGWRRGFLAELGEVTVEDLVGGRCGVCEHGDGPVARSASVCSFCNNTGRTPPLTLPPEVAAGLERVRVDGAEPLPLNTDNCFWIETGTPTPTPARLSHDIYTPLFKLLEGYDRVSPVRIHKHYSTRTAALAALHAAAARLLRDRAFATGCTGAAGRVR